MQERVSLAAAAVNRQSVRSEILVEKQVVSPELLLERRRACGGLYLVLPVDVLLLGDARPINAALGAFEPKLSSTPWVKKCRSTSTSSAVLSPC